MHLSVFRRGSGVVAAALLAALLSACSGGGSTPQSTALPTTQSSSERALGTLSVTRASAPAIMKKVASAAAYYTPMQGQPRPVMHGLPGGLTKMSTVYDLTNYGGPTVYSESAYDIYVNCGSASCWGAPGTFLGNLASTSFIHLLDQYIGSSANGRYTYAGGYLENYDTSYTLQDQDIYNIVHAVAVSTGSGYGHIYNVFLMNGVSQCSASAGGCYGQQYCAYHGAVDFTDIGHTLYSVEPYQGISGCSVPNGRLADSTNSTLSHEYYEAITDPDVQTNVAWYNNTYGEIGDICRNSYGYTTVGSSTFELQREWSNNYGSCSFSP